MKTAIPTPPTPRRPDSLPVSDPNQRSCCHAAGAPPPPDEEDAGHGGEIGKPGARGEMGPSPQRSEVGGQSDAAQGEKRQDERVSRGDSTINPFPGADTE